MFKFLRRYNKWILAVGGVLLMITFLIPEAIQQFSQRAGATGASTATIGDGKKVSAGELELATAELRLLARLDAFQGLDLRLPHHWYLLTYEANQAGLVGTGAMVDDEAVQRIRELSGDSQRFVRETLAKAMAVEEMLRIYDQSGGVYSDRRLVNIADRMMHQVHVQSVVLQADPKHSALEPTEGQLAAHMQKYGDVAPGQGEMGFGYKLPDRVKLEWLEIPADSVRRAVQQSEQFDGVRQRLHWRYNPSGVFPPVQEGAPVPDEVKDDLLAKLTKEKLDEIARTVSTHISQNMRGIREREGWYELPSDWEQRQFKLTDLAAEIQRRHGVELPAYQAAGDRWLTASDIEKLPGIGAANTPRFGQQPMTLAQLVPHLREFGGSAGVPVQQNVAGPPLRTEDGSVYVFRIIDADKSRPPSSVDEVRESLVNDLKKLDHYQRLAEQVSTIEQQAQVEGLLTVALDHDTIVQPEMPVALCNRMLLRYMNQLGAQLAAQAVAPMRLPVIGEHKATSEQIIERARALPADASSLENVPEEQRTFVLPVQDKLSVMVVRLMRQDPLSRQEYQELVKVGAIHFLLATDELRDDKSLKEAFSLEALTRRHNFQMRGRDERDDADESQTNANAAPPLADARR